MQKPYQAPIQWDVNPKQHYNWDGEHINVLGMKEDGVLHELGHWLVVPEISKYAKDYGLGGGPDSPTSNFVYGMYKDTGQEETLACIMEFFLGVLCEMDMADGSGKMSEADFELITHAGFTKKDLPALFKLTRTQLDRCQPLVDMFYSALVGKKRLTRRQIESIAKRYRREKYVLSVARD